ncbi:MAG: type I restriction enzyme HsdR N-terminal domain-containing protein [Muribaculaceae bacterium]|nr:type I restriction enzyme HsdR N-terminal domain-containing protein [Muribaculaceae bacterium]
MDARLRPDADSTRQGLEIYDRLRQRWVALTPEEWVRQHFVAFLEKERGFPEALMGNEVSLSLNGMSRRCDTVVFTRNLKPLCIVEYKAPEVKITQKVFDQIARYNSVMQAMYLIVSNGLQHYCCRFEDDGYKFLHDIPQFENL